MNPADVSQADIRDAVNSLQYEDDDFKPLVIQLGGATVIAVKVRAAFVAFGHLGWDALEGLVQTAFAVTASMVNLLGDFIRALIDMIRAVLSGVVRGIGAAVGGVVHGVGHLARGRPLRAIGSGVGGVVKGAGRVVKGGLSATRRGASVFGRRGR